MNERSVKHGTFTVERRYPAHPAKVFGAWADIAAKEIWMDDPDFKSDGSKADMDFRVGGHEHFSGLAPDGTPYRYEALYYDIVPDRHGSKLTYTEQGAFLDDIDNIEEREEGTSFLLGGLGKYLASHSGG